MANSPQEVLVQCRQHDVKAVALHVTDVLGQWHQVTIPVARLTEESFEDGFEWTLHMLAERRGEVADVLLVPQPSTAFIHPYAEMPTLGLLCVMHDPLTREEIPDDPRTIALNAQKYAKESGVADEVLLSLSLEFFLFGEHPLSRGRRGTRRAIETAAQHEESLDGPRPVSRSVSLHDDDFRTQAMHALVDCGVEVAAHRQSSRERWKSCLELSETGLVEAADNIMIAKHVIRRLAAREGKSATFMPLPCSGLEPAGMPTQLALMKHEKCALSGSGYAGLSEAGLHAIGGILKHAGALTAFTNSSTNSYSRLATWPGMTPKVAYSQSDLRAYLRVPTSRSSKQKNLELRVPDAISNPYLAFSAMLMAAVDGIQNKVDPGAALDPDPYAPVSGYASESLSTSYPPCPGNLDSALEALSQDGEFLLRGDVFTPELLESWIRHKRMVDLEALRSDPHPRELQAYYDA